MGPMPGPVVTVMVGRSVMVTEREWETAKGTARRDRVLLWHQPRDLMALPRTVEHAERPAGVGSLFVAFVLL